MSRASRGPRSTLIVPAECAAALLRAIDGKPRPDDDAPMAAVALALQQTTAEPSASEQEAVTRGDDIALGLTERERVDLIALALIGEPPSRVRLRGVRRRLRSKVRAASRKRSHGAPASLSARRGRAPQSFGVPSGRRRRR